MIETIQQTDLNFNQISGETDTVPVVKKEKRCKIRSCSRNVSGECTLAVQVMSKAAEGTQTSQSWDNFLEKTEDLAENRKCQKLDQLSDAILIANPDLDFGVRFSPKKKDLSPFEAVTRDSEILYTNQIVDSEGSIPQNVVSNEKVLRNGKRIVTMPGHEIVYRLPVDQFVDKFITNVHLNLLGGSFDSNFISAFIANKLKAIYTFANTLLEHGGLVEAQDLVMSSISALMSKFPKRGREIHKNETIYFSDTPFADCLGLESKTTEEAKKVSNPAKTKRRLSNFLDLKKIKFNWGFASKD